MLRGHIEAALADVDSALRAVKRYEPRRPALSRKRPYFHDALLDLLQRLKQHRTNLSTLPLEEGWRGLDTDSREITRTLAEALAFLQGGRLRDAGVDDGLCDLADALVVEIAGACDLVFAGFTVPAEQELYDTNSQLIRVRFPSAGIWDLPVVAHEFGHHAVRAIRDPMVDRSLIESFIEARAGQSKDPRTRQHLLELAADLFALHTCGPAYMCSVVFTRFSPLDPVAVEPSATHPSHGRRAHAMLGRLREQTNAVGDPWIQMADDLRAAWERNLLLAGVNPPPTIPDGDDEVLANIWQQLRLKESAGFAGWLQAAELARAFRQPRFAPPGGRKCYSLREILNAAWLARAWWPAAAGTIDTNSRALASAVSAAEGPPTPEETGDDRHHPADAR
jgi:hypothetical protein